MYSVVRLVVSSAASQTLQVPQASNYLNLNAGIWNSAKHLR